MCKNYRRKRIETEIISIRQSEIRSYIACGKCSEIYECALNDGVNEIIEKIKKVQVASLLDPQFIFWNCTRGDLMSALQRIGMFSRSSGNFLSWEVEVPLL